MSTLDGDIPGYVVVQENASYLIGGSTLSDVENPLSCMLRIERRRR